jgi:hypothetical protein
LWGSIVRIPEQFAVRAKNDRKLFVRHLEPAHERPCTIVLDRVEPLVGMPVPAEEVDQPQDIPVSLVADDDRTRAGLDQSHPPKNERAHDPLAQFGFRDEQSAQSFGRNRDALDVGQRLGVHQHRAA